MLRDRLLTADHRLAVVAHRLGRRVGWRGLFLAGAASLDLVWATTIYAGDTAAPVRDAPAFRIVVGFGAHVTPGRPLLVWAILFALVGITCGWQVWVDDDRGGYAAAVGLKVLLAILTLAAWPVAGTQILRPAAQWICLCIFVVAAQRGIPSRQD